jgi:hypothetical protein
MVLLFIAESKGFQLFFFVAARSWQKIKGISANTFQRKIRQMDFLDK